MKLEITIEGIPLITHSINYTRNGKEYTPASEIENERALRAAVISSLPYDFKILRGPLKINLLRFVFPPNRGTGRNELETLNNEGLAAREGKPSLIECLKSIIKAMNGTVFVNDSRICSIENFGKYSGLNPAIKIEIEEVKQ